MVIKEVYGLSGACQDGEMFGSGAGTRYGRTRPKGEIGLDQVGFDQEDFWKWVSLKFKLFGIEPDKMKSVNCFSAAWYSVNAASVDRAASLACRPATIPSADPMLISRDKATSSA